ncbi:hypothetical protein F8M41_015478 [Gigaspora margarita]|uniref:Uncharacterized protein n=1 Tax=Gigaspora margarita TaxID=4874 RepID=A0A8H4EN59_GIGMA|nr:hypothetical protein F8M41_015478 [Gigaspora margarita]
MRPNQYETHTSKSGSQNSNKEESTNNDMNTELPKSEFYDFILDLINDYLAEKPLVKREKEQEAIQEPSKVSGLENDDDKISKYCQKSTEIEAATKIYTIRPCSKKEGEGKKISN